MIDPTHMEAHVALLKKELIHYQMLAYETHLTIAFLQEEMRQELENIADAKRINAKCLEQNKSSN